MKRQSRVHTCEYEAYNDEGYGIVVRCECGKLDPSRYSNAERGYPDEEENES